MSLRACLAAAICCAAAAVAAAEPGLPAGPGMASATLTVGGKPRQVLFYLPARRAAPPPLWIAFHGTSGEPQDIFGSTSLQELADEKGFIVAAPAARRRGPEEGDWDNHSGDDRYWETWPAVDPAKNADLLLVRAIIDRATVAYGVDPARVYVVGFSNGGFFAVMTAMVLRDRIAAFAESESGLVRCERTDGCTYPFRDGALAGAPATTCAAIRAAAPASCRACAGPEKPAAVPAGGRVPPGLLSHNLFDDAVSVYYSCDLAARMEQVGAQAQVDLWSDRAAGHGLRASFAQDAWTFFSTRALRR